MALRKTAEKGSTAKRAPASDKQSAIRKSMPREGRDPKGGLTAKGREYFNKKEGSHLRPGVQGPADTPEKMVRKGSFLRRHFTHPRGPMENDKGEPTRLALSAHAWGEPVPKTVGDAKKLAREGHELLEQYHRIRDEQGAGRKTSDRQPGSRLQPKPVIKKGAAKKSPPRKQGAKASVVKKTPAKRAAATQARHGRSSGRPATAAKRIAAKKGVAVKGSPAKKSPAKKSPAKKIPAKKIPAKKSAAKKSRAQPSAR